MIFKNKDIFSFVRFGSLNLNKQKGYGKNTYHSPPASRGFFAFPKIAQEIFLIGLLDKTQPDTFMKEKGDDIDYDALYKQHKKAKQNMRKEFRKSIGHIWHHLIETTPHHLIIATHNEWIKTTIKNWAKAFMKESLKNRYGEGSFTTNSINDTRGLNGYYSKDSFEVFFDEKVG